MITKVWSDAEMRCEGCGKRIASGSEVIMTGYGDYVHILCYDPFGTYKEDA